MRKVIPLQKLGRARTKRKPLPLERLRRARTLNQKTLARLVGVSQQTYSKYESGVLVPDVDVQAHLAAILGASRAECGFLVSGADRVTS